MNKADQIFYHARFVVRDLEEERSNSLSKYFKVGVRWLSDDRLEVFEGVAGFFHTLLGCYVAPKMARLSS